MKLFLDQDYKVDCENKIDYNNLIKVTTTSTNFFGYTNLYKVKNKKVYLVDVTDNTDNFYTKNVNFIMKIGANLYKAVIL